MDELPKAEQVAIEAAMVKAHREADCFRCHDGKTEYEGKVLSRKCLTCHIDEKLEEYLF
jgi:cytochrome c nitrite reductase small subunit